MAELVRFADWEMRLAVYLDRVREDPFKWGDHDCALFAGAAIRAMTGTDPAEEYRGTYDDARGAALALRKLGKGTLTATTNDWLGQSVDRAFAQRGSIVLKGRTALGVCVGPWSWFVGEEGTGKGLIALPTLQLSRAWTIPISEA